MKLYLIRFAISISLWRRGAKSECYFLMLVTPPPVSSQNANSPARHSLRNRFAGRRRRNYLVTKGKNGGPHLESISIRHVRTKYSALHFSCSFSTTTILHPSNIRRLPRQRQSISNSRCNDIGSTAD